MAVEFPQKPPTLLQDLWLACQRAFWSLGSGAKAYVIKDITVDTVATTIAHGLKAAPRAVFWQTTGDSVGDLVTEAQPADERYVYLKAGSAVTGNLLVVP